MEKIRVRIAPSPTGRIHVGNLRTFIFNYLYAKAKNGTFLLRIEDTDQKRQVEGGIDATIEVLKLYGLNVDEGPKAGGEYGPYVQSERKELYKKYADDLVEKGAAYRCFCSEEKLAEMRERQEKSKQRTGYNRGCRDRTKEETDKRVEAGEEYVVRLKFPQEGRWVYKDTVFGKISIPNEDVEDIVLLKSDGYPTYNFGVVVDDHLMGITHTIRAREYLSETPKNEFIYKSLGWEPPVWVHVPEVMNPDGDGKLSKRKGALPAIAYLRKGYFPEAMLNFLSLLGWAPASESAHQDEIYNVDELVKLFDIDRIHKSQARYDEAKLNYINGKHIRNLDTKELVERIYDWAGNLVLQEFITDKYDDHPDWEGELRERVLDLLPKWKENEDYFFKALKLVHERLVYLSELPDLLDFFYEDNLSWTDEDWNTKNHSKEELAKALSGILPKLDELFSDDNNWNHDAWEQLVRSYADELEWKHGDLFMAIRSASTGRLKSPPLLECFEVIGWEKVKGHIENGIEWLKT